MPRIRTAHKFSERQRTGDVLTDELVDFKSLLLSPDVLKGLNSSGFERPSPIQLKAIPLGRCGLDLISQAKSGTGKTCVFSVVALESLSLDSNTTQVLILAPTREIAVQIKEVITSIGSQMDNLVCHVFIGGLPVEDNKKMLKKPCHIAVGTPGRIKFLIENHFLKTDSVRLFILDEADKLLEDNFQEQINWIFSSLPSNKQMMAFSATYPEYLAKHLTQYMREPTFVRLNATDPTLQGIKQFYKLVPFHPLPHKIFQEKVSELLKLLSSLPFHQCLVFSNYQIRAQSLCDTLRLKGWPSVFIAGSQNQSQRLKAMEKLKEFKCRVLISTDLTSRGIDAEHVNLVVNMDVPRDPETYLHRIGRAGRFGTQGFAVTFVAQREEDKLFKKMEENIGITVDTLPDPIPQSLRTSEALEPRTASVEVDILTNSSMTKLAKNSQELSTVETSTRPVNSGKMICIGGELPENDSHKKNAKIVVNQDKLPVNDGTDLLPENSERNLVTAATQETSETFSHCGDNEKENYDKKHLEKAQSKSDVNVLHRHDTAVRSFQDESEVVLQTGLIKSSEEEIVEHQSSIPSAERSTCSVAGSEHISSKLQDLKLDTRQESNGFHKSALHFQTNAYNESQVDNKQTKHQDIDYQTTSSPADGKQLCESLSDEESSDSERSETEETFNAKRGVYNATSTEEDCDVNDQLPSVEEFEKDFEKFMENVSNFDHLVEASPISSEMEDELEGAGCLDSDLRDDSYNRTPATASMSTNHFDVSSDSHNYKLHVHSNPILPHQNTAVSNNSVHAQKQYQTGNYCVACDKSLSAENSNSYLYPDVSNAYYDGWRVHNDSYNYRDNYDSHYNYYPQGGSYGANYSVQSAAYSASWQQCFDQSCDDIGSCQDNQWNMSWYNAYQRQINSIRQFVSFSRTVRF